MIEQIANSQWMFSRHRTSLTSLRFLPFELRNVILDQIVEWQLPFIDQHHDGDCDEPFGNRSGPKNGRGLQRFFVNYALAD